MMVHLQNWSITHSGYKSSMSYIVVYLGVYRRRRQSVSRKYRSRIELVESLVE